MPNTIDGLLAYRVSPRMAIAIVVAMLVAAGIAEIVFIPQNVVIPILYPAAVAACLWSRNLRFLWTTVSVSILLAVFVQRFALQPAIVDVQDVMLINRLATAITTLVVALFVHHGIRTHSFAIGQLLTLGEQNGALGALNEELGRREEEIVRQNEELQSQTEELERQTEELRVTNEELASWEKRLEQLLELARSLTAETSRGEVFSKICETLGAVAETHATALLEREADDIRIHCHSGFGPEGVKSDVIRYAESFSSQVMQLGQTGVACPKTFACGRTCRFPNRKKAPSFEPCWRLPCASMGVRSVRSRHTARRLVPGRRPKSRSSSRSQCRPEGAFKGPSWSKSFDENAGDSKQPFVPYRLVWSQPKMPRARKCE